MARCCFCFKSMQALRENPEQHFRLYRDEYEFIKGRPKVQFLVVRVEGRAVEAHLVV